MSFCLWELVTQLTLDLRKINVKKIFFGFLILPFFQSAMAGNEDWNYKPVDINFWTKATELQTANQSNELLRLALEAEAKYNIKSIRGAEAAEVVAKTLKQQGFPTLSFEIFKKILAYHPGSMPAIASLLEINSMSDTSFVDEEALSRLINLANFTDYPKELESMIYYYTALDNMKRGLNEWIASALAKVDPKTHWGQRLKYFRALEKIKKDDYESAKSIFHELIDDAGTNDNIKYKASWNLARLLFEQKEYDQAEAIFYKLSFQGRDLGQSLLERAWLRYYKKDYSTSLGTLESLRAPYFINNQNPEQYMLSMFIYRDLCHYPSVKEKLREFEQIYQSLIAQIKNKKNVEKNDLILANILIHSPYKDKADFINNLRKEGQELKKQFSGKLMGLLRSTYEESLLHEKQMKMSLQRSLPDLIDLESNRLLTNYDNLLLLDYISDLDELRINQRDKRSYESAKVTTLGFDSLFWPVNEEYWWEELKNYKVLIDDRCSAEKVNK